jgi:hypothetical protein
MEEAQAVTKARSLAEAYPAEQARLRRLLEVYRELGPVGAFGHAMISDVARRADEAVAQQDAVAMIRMYEEMKGCK